MIIDDEPATRTSLPEAFAALEAAQRAGDPHRLGEAHLEVVAALAHSLQDDPGGASEEGSYGLMLTQADQAVAVYRQADFAWGLADAYLVKAALLADRAIVLEGEAQAEAILESFDLCHLALRQLYESGDAPLPLLRQAHAMAGSVLLRLETALGQADLPEAFGEYVSAMAESVGETLAWETRLETEGAVWLWLARACGSLAEALPEPGDREEAVQMAREAGEAAALRYGLTGDGRSTRQAWAAARGGGAPEVT